MTHPLVKWFHEEMRLQECSFKEMRYCFGVQADQWRYQKLGPSLGTFERGLKALGFHIEIVEDE